MIIDENTSANTLLLEYIKVCEELKELKRQCSCCKNRHEDREVPRPAAREVANSLISVRFEEGGGHD